MINPIYDGVMGVVDRVLAFIPNPQEKAKAKIEAESRLIEIIAQENQAQSEVNKVEAANPSVFVSGWRPAIGWIGASCLGWAYVLQPMVSFLAPLVDPSIVIPSPKMPVDMFDLILGMLGIGGMRTFEKVRGVTR
jgi:hypothetical protein